MRKSNHAGAGMQHRAFEDNIWPGNTMGELLGGFPFPKEDELGQAVWVCSSWPYGWPRSPMGVESHGCPLEGGPA